LYSVDNLPSFYTFYICTSIWKLCAIYMWGTPFCTRYMLKFIVESSNECLSNRSSNYVYIFIYFLKRVKNLKNIISHCNEVCYENCGQYWTVIQTMICFIYIPWLYDLYTFCPCIWWRKYIKAAFRFKIFAIFQFWLVKDWVNFQVLPYLETVQPGQVLSSIF